MTTKTAIASQQSSPLTQMSFVQTRQTKWFRVVLILLVILVLGRICTNDFTRWDDKDTLYANPDLNPPTVKSVASYWTRYGSHAPMGLYVPFTYTIWGGLAWMGFIDRPDDEGVHLNPYVFHGASLIVHALAALVVFEITRRIVRNDKFAFLGSALFAIHPVQVEAVAWTSGMKDLLCGLLGFLALLMFMQFRDTESKIGTKKSSFTSPRFLLATLLFTLAMLSKPTAMVLPAIALVIDRVSFDRPLRTSLSRLWPWFALSFVCAIIAKASQQMPGMPLPPTWTRPFIAGDSLAFYIVKLVFPWTLAIDYARTPFAPFSTGAMYYTPLLPLTFFLLLWWKRRTTPILITSGLIFVIGVLPVLGFTPFMFQFYSGVADHYLYIPMLGVALMAAIVLMKLPSKLVRPFAITVLLLCGLRSFVQAGVWQTDFLLNLNLVQNVPQSFVGQNNIVRHYTGFYDANPKDPRSLVEALKHADAAVRLRPEIAWGYDTRASVYVRAGRTDRAIADIIEYVRHVEQEIGPSPSIRDTTLSRVGLGLLYQKQGDYVHAVEQFEIAARRRPEDPAILKLLHDAQHQSTTRAAP